GDDAADRVDARPVIFTEHRLPSLCRSEFVLVLGVGRRGFLADEADFLRLVFRGSVRGVGPARCDGWWSRGLDRCAAGRDQRRGGGVGPLLGVNAERCRDLVVQHIVTFWGEVEREYTALARAGHAADENRAGADGRSTRGEDGLHDNLVFAATEADAELL